MNLKIIGSIALFGVIVVASAAAASPSTTKHRRAPTRAELEAKLGQPVRCSTYSSDLDQSAICYNAGGAHVWVRYDEGTDAIVMSMDTSGGLRVLTPIADNVCPE